MAFKFFHYETLDSTMDQAKRNLDFESDFLQESILIASEQTGGRGRQGRIWHSPTGNLYASFIVKNVLPVELTQFALLWGVVLRQSIAEFTDANVQCKWPNDVLIQEKKVAGILIEPYTNALIVGLGVNVAHTPEPVQFPATHINDHVANPVSIPKLVNTIAKNFEEMRQNWQENGFESVRTSWLDGAWRREKEIIIRQEHRNVVGIFETIDADGALCINKPDGSTEKLYVGDLI